ncbi:hypothetical protein MMC22_008525 [Lobaria immixta]|nr:hypothetical protein [Lobaria immixta]
MNYSFFSILFLLTIKTLALPSAFGDEHSVEPINELDALLTPMTYIGPIDSSGETHRINGTAEEIHEKILALNPEFNPHDWPRPATSPAKGPSSVLEKRSKIPPPNCDFGEYVRTKHILYSIDRLNHLPGVCYADFGSGKCARISCSRYADIILCNDNDHAIALPCRSLAGHAQEIVNHCQLGTTVRGQIFDTDDYNVVIRAGNCYRAFEGQQGDKYEKYGPK